MKINLFFKKCSSLDARVWDVLYSILNATHRYLACYLLLLRDGQCMLYLRGYYNSSSFFPRMPLKKHGIVSCCQSELHWIACFSTLLLLQSSCWKNILEVMLRHIFGQWSIEIRKVHTISLGGIWFFRQHTVWNDGTFMRECWKIWEEKNKCQKHHVLNFIDILGFFVADFGILWKWYAEICIVLCETHNDCNTMQHI